MKLAMTRAEDEGLSKFGVGRMHLMRKNTTAVQIAIEAVIEDIGEEHDGTCDVIDDVNGVRAGEKSIGGEDITPDACATIDAYC